MRSIQPGLASATKLLAIAVLGLAAACTPNLEDKLACENSTQCPTGYFCAADRKCQQGDTVPEITVLTQTAGITFSGTITLELSVIDPAGVTGVTVGLAGPGGDAGSPITATPAQNNIYTAVLDTRALGIASSGTFTATILATNGKGKTSTATVQLTVNDQAPTITAVAVTPANVSAGQPATISFNTGEALAELPVVKLTPPDSSAPRHAAYVSLTSDHTYTYQFVPLATDPLGTWKVQITAQDSLGNSASSSGNDAFTVSQGGAQSITFSAKRDADGVVDARAYALKSGATTTITATFGAALGGNPSGFLCPIGTPGPCTASTAGATTLTSTAGTGAHSYVFHIPAIAGSPSSPSEGNHVFTVTGSSTGSTISGSVNVTYDFTAPKLTIQQVNSDQRDDENGRLMVSKARYSNGVELDYLLVLNETLPEQQPPVVTVDGLPNALLQPAAHPDSALLPEYTLTLDGTLAEKVLPVPDSAGHYVGATVCDAANNCTLAKSELFVEVDGPALIAFQYPTPDGVTADGGAPVLRAGDTVNVGVDLDRTLGGSSSDYSIQVSLTDGNPNDQIDFETPPLEEASGKPATPFGYYFSSILRQGVSDGTYAIQVTYGYDGYGNLLSSGFSSASNPTPVVQTSGPFVTIKSSIPQLSPANSGGGVIAAQTPVLGASSSVNVYFIAQSNGVVGAYEDLSKGTITACVNPNITSASLVCPSLPGPNNGITLTVDPPSGVSGGSPAVHNYIGEITISTSATPTNGQQFILVNYTDAAGNVGALPMNLNVSTLAPTLGSYQFDKTVVGVGQTATALVSFDPNNSGTVVTGSAGSLTGVTESSRQTSVVHTVAVSFRMPAACNGGVNPTDGTPFPVYVTLNDGSNAPVTAQIGTLTCTATSIANATVLPSSVYLIKQPMFDGTVRSVVLAAPGAITGISGSAAGVSLVALQGATVLGSGAVSADGSVAEFQLSSALTQVTLRFTDGIGNIKTVTNYPEQLLINGAGAAVNASQNPMQLTDVSTGDDTFYPAPYWADGGPGVDGGVAGPVVARASPDAGASAGAALSAIASVDNQSLSVATAPPFQQDGGLGVRMTYLGTETYGNPILLATDAGIAPFSGPVPPARSSAAMEAYGNGLFLLGGLANGSPVEPSGTYWTWSRDTGWTKNVNTNFDGGSPATTNIALGIDPAGQVLVFGGQTSAVTGLYTTYLANGGVNQWWGTSGNLGTPTGDGGVTGFVSPQVYSATTLGQYGATVLDTNLNGTTNCLVYVPASPFGIFNGPSGSQVYSCATTNGLADARHNFTALAPGSFTSPSGANYNVFAFGGKYNASTGSFASNDLLAGSINYNYFYNGQTGVANYSYSWTPLTPAAGSPLPAPRSSASLYYISSNRLGLYGGVNAVGQPLNDSWEYDLPTNTWAAIDNPHANAVVAPPRANPASAAINGSLYVFGGGNGLADGWMLARESRNRYIVKVPVASQLSSPAAAQFSQLTVTVSNPNGTFYNSSTRYDLYLWNGANWALTTSLGPVEQFSIPSSAFPSLVSGDGNIYLMVAGVPSAYDGNSPPPITLDALDFALNFQ